MYTADLVSLIECYELLPYLYADNTQIYGSCSPCDIPDQSEPVHLRCRGMDAVQLTPT